MVARRTKAARSASGEGFNFCSSSFARMKASIGWRTQAFWLTFGTSGAFTGCQDHGIWFKAAGGLAAGASADATLGAAVASAGLDAASTAGLSSAVALFA